MRTLIGIPVVNNLPLLKETIDSCKKAGFDRFLIVLNGANNDIIEYAKDFEFILNSENIGVNKAWNQIIEYFLTTDLDRVVIANSDISIKENFKSELDKIKDDFYIIPNVVDKFSDFKIKTTDEIEGIQSGVFIILNRNQIKIVYPIQTKTDIWFGDSDILQRLKRYQPVKLFNNLQLKHEISATIRSLDISNKWHQENKVWLDKIKFK
jgi:hypothetical protein